MKVQMKIRRGLAAALVFLAFTALTVWAETPLPMTAAMRPHTTTNSGLLSATAVTRSNDHHPISRTN